jgi:hypothetical protein
MTARTYLDILAVLDLTVTELTAIETDRLWEIAVGALNMYGAELAEPTGAYGSMTADYELSQWTAVITVFKWVYADLFDEGTGDFEMSGLSVKSKDYLQRPTVINQLMAMASSVRPDAYDDILLV